jgi:MoaA/NifB/PqqE/SkfB family radical SAM enzyme
MRNQGVDVLKNSKIYHFMRNMRDRISVSCGFYPLPRMINFVVTNKCNARCLTCNIWKSYLNNPELAKNELQLEEIKEIFSKNHKYLKNVEFMQITGGEPSIRSDLPQIISEIHKVLPNCNFWIATNGLLPNRIKSIVETVYESCNCKIGVGISIDGSKDCHDRMRGIEGAYIKAIESIKNLIALKEQIPDLHVAISYTITGYNFREVEYVIDLTRKFNVDFTFRPVNISSEYYKNVEKDFGLKKVNFNDLEYYLEKIKGYIAQQNFLKRMADFYYLDGTLRFIKTQNNRKLPCYAGFTSFFLNQLGDVYPCLMLNDKMGNLRDQSFNDIWGSERAKIVRNKIKRLDCPKCWVECETYRDIWIDFFSPLKFCLKKFIKGK